MGLRITWERAHKHRWRHKNTTGYDIRNAHPIRYRETALYTCGCSATREVVTESARCGA